MVGRSLGLLRQSFIACGDRKGVLVQLSLLVVVGGLMFCRFVLDLVGRCFVTVDCWF